MSTTKYFRTENNCCYNCLGKLVCSIIMRSMIVTKELSPMKGYANVGHFHLPVGLRHTEDACQRARFWRTISANVTVAETIFFSRSGAAIWVVYQSDIFEFCAAAPVHQSQENQSSLAEQSIHGKTQKYKIKCFYAGQQNLRLIRLIINAMSFNVLCALQSFRYAYACAVHYLTERDDLRRDV